MILRGDGILAVKNKLSQVDPAGKRTIGVLTKPDLINPGGEAEVLEVLSNNRKPLKLGYVMVKVRDSWRYMSAIDALAQATAPRRHSLKCCLLPSCVAAEVPYRVIDAVLGVDGRQHVNACSIPCE